MSSIMDVSVALATLNTVLAIVLASVYARNHWDIRSPFTLGLLLFALFLLVNNAVTVYHFVTMMPMFASVDETLILVENILQFGALVALVVATLR